jgi:hypothetical protein
MRKLCGVILFMSSLSFAQLAPVPRFQFFDNAGKVCSDCQLKTYAAGTSTPLATYSDSSLSTANPTTIPLNSAGRPTVSSVEVAIYLAAESYKFQLVSATGSTIWMQDNVVATATISDIAAIYASLASTIMGKGDSLIGYKSSGTGSVARTVHDRLSDLAVSVLDFGVTGDGITDDAPKLRSIIREFAGKTLFFPVPPGGAYILGSGLGIIPANTRLVGDGKSNCIIRRAYNGGYLATLNDGVSIEGIWFDGNGRTYTGGIVDIPAGHGNQLIRDAKFINTSGGTPIHFTCTGAANAQVGGSRSRWLNVEAWRVDGRTGSGNYAIVHDDPGVPAAGHPIAFSDLETGGYASIDLGAVNDFYVTSSTLFSLKFSDNTRGFHIAACRICPIDAIEVKGSGDIVGCGIGPLITLMAGSAVNMGPNFYNNGWIDNSGNSQTLVYDQAVFAYTPIFYGGGVAFTMGNGRVVGKWSRDGTQIRIDVYLSVGTTTTIPSGAITMDLPFAANSSITSQGSFGGDMNTGGGNYMLSGRVADTETVLRLLSPNGLFTNTVPAAIGDGTAAAIHVSGTYTK